MLSKAVLLAACMGTAVVSGAAVRTQHGTAGVPAVQPSRTVTAVTYARERKSEIDLVGTPLLPRASGDAEVTTDSFGPARLKVRIRNMVPARELGPEYLTYVLWAVSPQGHARNLGELRVDDSGAIEATCGVPTFAIVVTAEPYYAVTRPSDAVVLENVIHPGTHAGTPTVTVQYDTAAPGAYVAGAASPYVAPAAKRREPADVHQARNALAIARLAGAADYDPTSLSTAERLLSQVEELVAERESRDDIVAHARAAVQVAEQARLQSVARRTARQAEQARQTAVDAPRGEYIRAGNATSGVPDERATLRTGLRREFNTVLDTRDTARGLAVSVNDAYFDTSGHNLRPDAQARLARFAAILQRHPGLSLRIEGFPGVDDSAANERLSQRRADAIGNFLLSQGLSADRLVTHGYGAATPAGTSGTADSRSQVRRVELVVSGDAIGTAPGSTLP